MGEKGGGRDRQTDRVRDIETDSVIARRQKETQTALFRFVI